MSHSTGLSRINDDAHFASQALGWYLAYDYKKCFKTNGEIENKNELNIIP